MLLCGRRRTVRSWRRWYASTKPVGKDSAAPPRLGWRRRVASVEEPSTVGSSATRTRHHPVGGRTDEGLQSIWDASAVATACAATCDSCRFSTSIVEARRAADAERAVGARRSPFEWSLPRFGTLRRRSGAGDRQMRATLEMNRFWGQGVAVFPDGRRVVLEDKCGGTGDGCAWRRWKGTRVRRVN